MSLPSLANLGPNGPAPTPLQNDDAYRSVIEAILRGNENCFDAPNFLVAWRRDGRNLLNDPEMWRAIGEFFGFPPYVDELPPADREEALEWWRSSFVKRCEQYSKAQRLVRRDTLELPAQPDWIIRNRRFMLEVLKLDGRALQYDRYGFLSNDEELVLVAVSSDGSALQFASNNLQDNDQVVLTAVKQYGLALEYASERIRGTKLVVLQAMRNDGGALSHASERLRGDRDVVVAAIKENGKALQNATGGLQYDRELLAIAVAQNEAVLRSDWMQQFRNDKFVVLAAVRADGRAYLYAGDDTKHDQDVILAAVSQNGLVIRYVKPEDVTAQVARAAMMQTCDAFEYLPPRWRRDGYFCDWRSRTRAGPN